MITDYQSAAPSKHNQYRDTVRNITPQQVSKASGLLDWSRKNLGKTFALFELHESIGINVTPRIARRVFARDGG